MNFFFFYRKGLGLLSFFLLCILSAGAQPENGIVDKIWQDEATGLPKHIEFRSGHYPALSSINELAKSYFHIPGQAGLQAYSQEKDKLGFTHTRYHELYGGYQVEGIMLIAHAMGDKIASINGEYHIVKDINLQPALTESAALKAALEKISAKTYRWQTENGDKMLQQITHNAQASWYPKGSLVICPLSGNYNSQEYRLAYKFDIYATEPLSRVNIFVDAITGKVLYEEELIHTADAKGTAVTKYSSKQIIVADSISKTSYKLQETGRGGGINTYNLKTGTTYSSAVDFTDGNNYWNNVNTAQDEVATDAHWGAEMTYDYYNTIHNRNSFDNAGGAIISYVHYYSSYNNAFWDGTEMNYGDGDGTNYTPFTGLDVCGHEISHGVTQHSAALAYQNESGAMNEGFSDIFGTCVEFFAKPSSADWLIGEDITKSGKGIRDMSKPKSFSQPNTYNGTYYVSTSGTPTSSNDYNGVHTNSGILNYWFYLVAHGGSGTNDNSNAYSVTGISIAEAQKITYRMLSVYLTYSSTFSDARYYSIRAAEDLYGSCSNEVKQVTNAWYAVGVGLKYGATGTPLSGTYTIGGSSPSYSNFTAAVKAINSKGICGPVIFNVRSGTYKEQVSIGRVNGTSSINTVTFQSQAGDSTKVILTSASSSSTATNYTLQLDSSAFIMFRQMTIQRTGSNTNANVIYLADNASNNYFMNNVIRGQYAVSTALSGANSLISNDASIVAQNVFYNNVMHAGMCGIYFYGSTSYLQQYYNYIGYNTIDSFGLAGIYAAYQYGVVITGNIVKSSSFSTSAYASYGIRAESDDYGLDISKNQVYMSGKAGYCRGILALYSANTSGYNDRIYNNFIRVSSGSTYSTGFYLIQNTYLNVFYNNVLNNYSSTTGAACWVDNGSNSTYDNFADNNFINKGGGYAWYFNAGYISTADYNNLYTSGSYIGYYSGNYSSLSSWRTGTGYDKNSKNIDPSYTSANDLHVSASGIDKAGAPIAGITDDIDGQNRDPYNPDIGADEFGTSNCLSGSYNIGGSASNYASFNAAVSALRKKGVCGPVVFNVHDSSYNETIKIGAVAGASATNTITFRSQSGDSSKVILYTSTSTGNYVLDLDSANWITFKQITIKRSNASSASTYNVIQLHDGASNNQFLNDRIIGIYSGSGTCGRAVYNFSSSFADTANIFRNNNIKYGYEGIHSEYSNSNIYDGNIIDSAYLSGIYNFYPGYAIIASNSITNLTDKGGDAINVLYGNNKKPVYIYKNKIAVKNNNGISVLGSIKQYSPVIIYNNFISVAGTQAATGIKIRGTANDSIYFNNISLSDTSSAAYPFYAYPDSIGGTVLENNNFINSGGGAAIYVNRVSAIANCSYNNIYSSGSNLAVWGGTKYTTLSGLQTGSSMNANSVNADPGYYSATDLHVTATAINSAGIPVNRITDDIDGDIRNVTTPDIGADEFTPSASHDAGVSAITSPAAGVCAGTTSNIVATIKNFGTDTLTSVKVKWSVNGTAKTVYSWTGTILPSNTAPVTLGSFSFASGSYKVKVWTDSPNVAVDKNHLNDTAILTVTVNPLPSKNAGAKQTICSGLSTTIGAASVSGHSYSWTSKPSGFTSASSNPTISPTVTTTYYLTETNTTTTCSNNDSVVIIVNPKPATPVATNSGPICAGDSLKLFAATVSGATYSWTGPNSFSSGSQNPSIASATTSASGTYSVTATISGCNSTAGTTTAKVNSRPKPAISGKTSVCASSVLTYSTTKNTGSTYAWYISGGTISSGASTNSVSVSWGSSGSGSLKVVETGTGSCSDSDAISITINANPSTAISGSDTVCAGSSTGYSTSSVTGNTYVWTISGGTLSSGKGTASVSVSWGSTSPASAKVVETNASGCKDSSSMAVVINPLPSATVIKSRGICQGDSISLGAAAVKGHLYSWTSKAAGFTSSASNPVVTPSVKTTYYLTETISATGCSKSDSVIIAVNPLPVAKVIKDTSICSGMSINIGAASVSGNTYTWSSKPSGFSSAISNPSVKPAATTVYYLKETTSSSCSWQDSVKITVNPLPLATVAANSSICQGDSLSIGASAVTGHTYSWTSSPAGFTSALSNPVVKPAATTTFRLTETISSSGCSNSDSVKITVNPLPSATAGTSQTICRGQVVSLGAASVSGHTYGWTSRPSGFTSTIANPSDSPSKTTTFYLHETITLTGCAKSDSVTISVNPKPAPSISGPSNSCIHITDTLSTAYNSGSSYHWSLNGSPLAASISNILTITWKSSGKESLQVVETNSYGCKDSAGITLNVHAQNSVLIAGTRVCRNNATVFADSSAPHASQLWNFGDGYTSALVHPSHTYAQAGIYTASITFKDADGCADTGVASVIVDTVPDAHWTFKNLGGRSVFFHADDSLLPVTDYHWEFGDLIGHDSAKIKHTYTADSSYSVQLTITNSHSCVGMYDSTIKITTTGLGYNEWDKFSAELYPNPFRDKAVLEYTLTKASAVQISIYAMDRRRLATLAASEESAGHYTHIISPEDMNMPAGVYFLRLSVDGQLISRKLVRVK